MTILRRTGNRYLLLGALVLVVVAVVGLYVVKWTTAAEIPIVHALVAAGPGSLGAGVLFTTLPAISLPSPVMAGWPFPSGCWCAWRPAWRWSSAWPSSPIHPSA